MTHQLSHQETTRKLDRDGKRRLVTVLIYLSSEALLLFAAAGRLDWFAAWAYVGLRLITMLTLGAWVARQNPELINERGRRVGRSTKSWDKVFMVLYAPMLFITPLVAGLDLRFGWSLVPVWLQVVAFVALIPAMILPFWAMAVNPFLVTTVRLQGERGQYVVDTGPYRYVRHPMYSGAVLMALASPVLLGSWWALIPGGVAAAAIIGRTALEDRALQAELPGYTDFSARTRYKLLPGVW